MPRSSIAKHVVVLGVALACTISTVVSVIAWRAEKARVGEWGFPLDDTWIHAQIARNVVAGKGWSFNPGVPVQNSSGPLWTAITAIGFAIAGPNIWIMKILALACLLVCIALAARLASLLDDGRVAPIAAALFTATSVPLTWHALSAMETILAALLVTAAFIAFVQWKHGRKRFAWPVLVALAVMTRPETLVLIPLFVFEQWRFSRRVARHDQQQRPAPWWRDAVVAGAIAAAVLLPYFVLNLHLSGSLFPTTFAAKAGRTGLASALREHDIRELCLSLTLYPYTWAVHAVAFFGGMNIGLLLAGALGVWAATRGPQRLWAPALLLVALPALRGTAAPHNLPSIQDGRYIACLFPLYYVCAALGLACLLRRVDPALILTRRGRLAWLGVAAVVGACWLAIELRVPHVGPGLWDSLPGLLHVSGLPKSISGALQQERFGLFLVIVMAIASIGFSLAGRRTRRAAAVAVVALAVGAQLERLPHLRSAYAQHVSEIDAMDVELGRWVKANLPPGTRVAVNDIGAIAFFGERPIVDAIGLATPELTPYWSQRRLRTLIGLRKLRPQACIVFRNWFPEWLTMSSLFVLVREHRVDKITILGGGTASVYRLDWDCFDRYYTDAMIERLDPVDADASFSGHVRRGMRNLNVLTRAQLYASAGDFLVGRSEFGSAERHYRRALELDPTQAAAWSGLLSMLDAQKRNDALMAAARDMAERQPESPIALEVLGQAQERLGFVTEAARLYQRALELRPDNLRLLRKLELVLSAQNDVTAAVAIHRRRLELERSTTAGTPAGTGTP